MLKRLKIRHIFLLLISIAYPENLFSKNYQQPEPQSLNVLKQDPQVWYQNMMQKYPDAGLENAKFVPSYFNCWYMEHGSKGQVYIACPSNKYYGYEFFTPDDELSLLHEAGHVRNHSWTTLFYQNHRQKALACVLAAACFLGTDGAAKSKNLLLESARNFKDNKCDVTANICIFSCLYGLLLTGIYKIVPPVLKRIDETLADNFANQHADIHALKDGYQHFMDHARMQKLYFKNWIYRWYYDFAHPASSDRADKIQKVLRSKFGELACTV